MGFSPGSFHLPLSPEGHAYRGPRRAVVARWGDFTRAVSRPPFYVFASSIAPAIEDAKIIPAKTPANSLVKTLNALKSP